MSYKISQVVVKFIRKSAVVGECWVDDPDLGRVSLEVAILARLQHPNIVKVRREICRVMSCHFVTMSSLTWFVPAGA